MSWNGGQQDLSTSTVTVTETTVQGEINQTNSVTFRKLQNYAVAFHNICSDILICIYVCILKN